jgi:hypothetical protein
MLPATVWFAPPPPPATTRKSIDALFGTVAEFDEELCGLVPFALVEETLNVYEADPVNCPSVNVYEVELVVAAVRGVSGVVPLRYGVIVIAERFLPPVLPNVHVTVTSLEFPDAVAVPIVGACGAVVGVTGLALTVLVEFPLLF